jgi:hypothetical protein
VLQKEAEIIPAKPAQDNACEGSKTNFYTGEYCPDVQHKPFIA